MLKQPKFESFLLAMPQYRSGSFLQGPPLNNQNLLIRIANQTKYQAFIFPSTTLLLYCFVAYVSSPVGRLLCQAPKTDREEPAVSTDAAGDLRTFLLFNESVILLQSVSFLCGAENLAKFEGYNWLNYCVRSLLLLPLLFLVVAVAIALSVLVFEQLVSVCCCAIRCYPFMSIIAMLWTTSFDLSITGP